MKKLSNKHLRFSIETIRQLDHSSLLAVAGGRKAGGSSTCDCFIVAPPEGDLGGPRDIIAI